MTIAPNSGERTWDAELTRLEADVVAAEALLAEPPHATAEAADQVGTEAWTPPTDLGPIPDSLLVRAQEVLERQLCVGAALKSAQAANTRQRGFAARVTDATVTRATPAYLDVSA